MKKLFVFLALFLIPIAFVQTVHAVSPDEKILTFDSKITITKQNKALITETIKYDLGATGHHGIYRDIPIDYHDSGNTYYLTAKHTGTTDENKQGVQAVTAEENGNYRIRLGDPENGSLTGVHTYKISYELYPIATKYSLPTKNEGKPFINLDLIGTGWQVPIQKASANIKLEDGANLSDVKCMFGLQGYTNLCAETKQEPDGSYSFAQTNLAVGQGMTVNAFAPNDYVSSYLIANQQRPVDWAGLIGKYWFYLLFVPAGLILLIILGLQKYRSYSMRKKQIVVAQYNPPNSLTPAEIGHLEDDSSDMAEVTATLISWAVRGYLKIEQNKTKVLGIFGGNDYTLTALKSSKDLAPTESALFSTFFATGKSVKLNDLDKEVMNDAVSAFKSATKKSLEEKGFYATKGGILEKGELTDAGAKEWALVDGFKLYLNVVEKDRLKFTDAPEKTPERFSKLLPYAVALGVEEQWAKQFEGIDVTQSTNNWYVGHNMATFSAASLVSDLNGGFSSAVESNSSVSSGGGSSGGGFGGGGGGSW